MPVRSPNADAALAATLNSPPETCTSYEVASWNGTIPGSSRVTIAPSARRSRAPSRRIARGLAIVTSSHRRGVDPSSPMRALRGDRTGLMPGTYARRAGGPASGEASMAGSGTREDPWQLTTANGGSQYQMWKDEAGDPPAIVCQVGGTQLKYDLRAIDDLHAWLKQQGDW